MSYLGFVVRNSEIKVSQESRESPLPTGHQRSSALHGVTGAELADAVRVKTTKSTPYICDSGKAPADKANSGLKLHRFGSAGTKNLPQERVTPLPQSPHREQQLSSVTSPGRGEAEPRGV